MNKLANDKMLAEYCGKKCFIGDYTEAVFLDEYDSRGECIKWQPSKDWKQLMEIVEKIEADGCEIFFPKTSCRIWKETGLYNGHTQIARAEADTKKQAVYQAVSEYVKQQTGG